MKQGHKSSEFWMVLAGMILITVMVVTSHEAGVPYITGLIAVYVGQRGYLKAKNGNGKQ